MTSPQNISNLVWIDLEMTGLNLKVDKPIQLATLVTDTNLNIIDDKGLVIHIQLTQEEYAKMKQDVKDVLPPRIDYRMPGINNYLGRSRQASSDISVTVC